MRFSHSKAHSKEWAFLFPFLLPFSGIFVEKFKLMRQNVAVAILLSSFLMLISRNNINKNLHSQEISGIFASKTDSLILFDSIRMRQVPVALYFSDSKKKKQKIVIFNHGYGQNKGGDNISYTYLTNYLASQGYFVASIQHELSSDSLMPLTGIPQIVRKPFWQRGVQNIRFVINELKKRYKKLDYQDIALIGHSNGGDMVMLFGQEYPKEASKIISLDNRRVNFPRTVDPRIYSLRSSDQVADEGVLPTQDEQKKFEITVIKLPNTKHNDMDDHATEVQAKEINTYLLTFLKDK